MSRRADAAFPAAYSRVQPSKVAWLITGGFVGASLTTGDRGTFYWGYTL